MSEPYLRLQQARRSAGFATASDAARFHGWNENTYRSHENGERGLKQKIAHNYARAFRVSPSWLMLGEGEHQTDFNTYATGWISADGNVIEDTNATSSKLIVRLPFRVPSDAWCFVFSDNSRYPRYAEWDLILLWGEAVMDIGLINVEGVGRTLDGKLLFGIFYGNEDGTATMESVGRPPVRNISIAELYPVQAVLRGGRYEPSAALKNPIHRAI